MALLLSDEERSRDAAAVEVARAGVKLRRVSTSRSSGVALRVRNEPARPLDEVALRRNEALML